MAEATVLICDECGRPEATSITIRAGGKNYVKDLCSQHLSALLKDTRSPRRGRPKASASGRGRPKASGTQSSRKRQASKGSTSRRKQRRRTSAKAASA